MPEGQRAPTRELGKLRDAYFDEEGRLYIADEALAREIQRRMAAEGRITMVRDRFAEEPRIVGTGGRSGEPLRPTYAVMADATATTDPTDPGTGTETSEPKANMMCPCEPAP